MQTFDYRTAYELNKIRKGAPSAILAASTAAIPMIAPQKPAAAAFEAKRANQLAKQRRLGQVSQEAASQQREKVEFEGIEKLAWQGTIFLNALGDIVDIAGFFVGIGTAITMAVDAFLLIVNLAVVGFNSKQKLVTKGNPVWWVLKAMGKEQIPVFEVVYFRSYRLYKLYKNRIKAAEEGIISEEV